MRRREEREMVHPMNRFGSALPPPLPANPPKQILEEEGVGGWRGDLIIVLFFLFLELGGEGRGG